MTVRVFLGMLTPSSNTILEPVTTAMVTGLPEVTAHFSRFKVTEIALSEPALAQFDDSEILRAAELLAKGAQQRNLATFTPQGQVDINADAGTIQARRVIERLYQDEQTGKPVVKKALV